MTCPWSRHDGAYLLGALSPEERRGYEEHLAGCPSCAAALGEVAGLPGLLARLPAGLLETDTVEATEPPPADLLPALLSAVRTERQRGRRRVGLVMAAAVGVATAAAAVAATVVFVVLPARSTPAPTRATSTAMSPVADVPVRATAALVGKSWGTEVSLRCTYSGTAIYPPRSYLLVAIDRGGHPQQVATWQAIPGQEVTVTGSTSLSPAQLAVLEVRTVDDRPLLRLVR